MGNINRFWAALYSQTGSELASICSKIGRYPDLVITNSSISNENTQSFVLNTKVIHLPKKPALMDYAMAIPSGSFVTLHGWLRILPPEICAINTIYNGHPGLILPQYYPELKGKDPQKRAYEGKYPTIGCVIHKVTPIVDDGEVLLSAEIDNECTSVGEMISVLRNLSIDMWTGFISSQLA